LKLSKSKPLVTISEAVSVVVDVVVADSVIVEADEALETEKTEVVAAADVEEVVKERRRTGFPLPSWVVWFKLARSRAWRKSTSSPCRSRRQKSSTTS
jgi:2-phosphoglycerate kinase